MSRIDLSDTTFIIPVRIDGPDRAFNLRWVVGYLLKTFTTKIIVRESADELQAGQILKGLDLGDSSLLVWEEKTSNPMFHRTRLLNEMLFLGELTENETPVTVNYDADVFMRPEAYVEARDMIVRGPADLVYPYAQGISQWRVRVVPRATDIGQDLFDPKFAEPWQSACGFCQFFRTSVYKAGGGENENFLAYGAEDVERMLRFQKLGYFVTWLKHSIWHLEHKRGPNSSTANPHFRANEDLYKRLAAMDKDELIAYYAEAAYLRKYRDA